MVALENVSKSYGERVALAPVSIEFAAGQTTVLIGPSGCGKSTLLRMIVGLVMPDTGRVVVNGETLGPGNVERVRHSIGYVIQDGGLFPHLKASENVTLLARHLGRDASANEARVRELAEMVSIPADALERYPQELSGGQRQRIGLMRALMLDPPLLLLDEPLGALDPVTRYELQGELKSIFGRLQKTVILVTHDMGEASYFADDLVMMRAGRIVQRGAFDDFMQRPAEPYVTDFIRAQRVPERMGTCMIARAILLALLFSLLLPALTAPCIAAQTINVGSKRFTESYILAEILAQTIRQTGEAPVTHQQGLGNTAIVFAAVKAGSIDLYPEYTGTIAFELLNRTEAADLDELRRALAPHGLGLAVPLGFSNTYAIAMQEKRAAELGIKRISDLTKHGTLRLGLSQEFLNRKDGWPKLKGAYALPHSPRGLDHGLAYEALAAGQIDVMDVYSTDAKITRYAVRQLEDDRRFFPAYDAVVVYRLDFPQRFPRAWGALQSLEKRIDTGAMARMNAEAELSGRAFSDVARTFVERDSAGAKGAAPKRTFWSVLFAEDLGRLTAQHLWLVVASLLPAIAVGIPLGTWAAYSRRASKWIMAIVGLLQTLPALALLAFLITLMGSIGTAPAVVALFLYALLPIVRNTASGLTDLATGLRESAHALGLPRFARLWRVELPLASRSILAGTKTSAVIAVGTATIAAFIGAGGYGERIVAGLAVNDTAMLLAGAIPAAVLALVVQWAFDGLERVVVPAGLRLRTQGGSGGG